MSTNYTRKDVMSKIFKFQENDANWDQGEKFLDMIIQNEMVVKGNDPIYKKWQGNNKKQDAYLEEKMCCLYQVVAQQVDQLMKK